jgi:membrane fusion protein, multidrug efflux system
MRLVLIEEYCHVLRRKPVLAINFLLFLSSAFMLSACSGTRANGPNRGAQPPAVPVTAATVISKTVPVQIRSIGNVEAFSTVQVKAQVGGQLMKVHFAEGQFVKKGDPLFTIDPRPFEATVNQIEANIQKDTALVKQAQANMAKDSAQARNAEVEARRYAELVERGVVSREQYDSFRTNADALKATVEADKAVIHSAEEAVKADEANLANAKLQLSYCSIRSPIDGRTGSLMVQAGNIIKANDVPIVVIDQIEPIRATFAVPEQQFADIKKYSDAGTLRVEALIPGDQQPIGGTISFLDNTVDPTTGTIKLKGVFPNADKRLWPGQFVNVILMLTVQSDAIVVPSSAVQTGQAGTYVFVINDDLTVQSRPVMMGRSVEGETVIDSGLQAGEKVVTDGQLRLVPGARVEIKNDASEVKP